MAEQLTDYAQFNGHQELSLVLSKVGGESTKHGPLVHGPGPWTRSIKIWTGPWTPFMDRVHGPPIFTTCTPKITEVNKNKIKSKVKLSIEKKNSQ